MTRQEFCRGIIGAIHRDLPSDQAGIVRYLVHQYRSYQNHPCFHEVAREISMVLTSRCSPEEFSVFCSDIDLPEPVISNVLTDCTRFLDQREYDRAAPLIRYILPFTERSWPENEDRREFRSFRDLAEYTYYMVVGEPEREVIIMPYLHTDILVQYGRLLFGTGKYEQALPVFRAAEVQSPVNAGVLGYLAAALLRTNHPDAARDIILRSFRCAWKKEDLAFAYRNQGYLFSIHELYDAAITCYLIAESWYDSSEGTEELRSLAAYTGTEIDHGFYNTHGRDILVSHGIPFGPDPEVTTLLVRIADGYLDEQDLFKAREYLIWAHQLLMSDPLEERIWRIERSIEDQFDL